MVYCLHDDNAYVPKIVQYWNVAKRDGRRKISVIRLCPRYHNILLRALRLFIRCLWTSARSPGICNTMICAYVLSMLKIYFWRKQKKTLRLDRILFTNNHFSPLFHHNRFSFFCPDSSFIHCINQLTTISFRDLIKISNNLAHT